MSHYGNSHKISDFSLLLSLLWLFMISNLWCYYYNWLVVSWIVAIQMVDLIGKCCVTIATPTSHSPISFSLGIPISWDTTILKLEQLITLHWPLKCSSDRKSGTSLTFNKKLEMITLSEEDMSKAKKGLLCPTVKLWMQRNKSLKEINSDHRNNMKA